MPHFLKPQKSTNNPRYGAKSTLWDRTYHFYNLPREEFLTHYHKRPQAGWTNSGESISGYQTLDFRVSRQIDNTRNSSVSTNFQIQFIAADGSPTGAALSLNKYLNLTGPVGLDDGSADGFLHPILQTVRIPLSDFTGANLSNVRGVRFVFSDTPKGAIYLANIRLSNQ